MATDEKSFEDKLEELEGIVSELEGGELSLERAIERFEGGQKLHRELMKRLDGYEKRIEELVDEPGEPAAGDARDEDEEEPDELPF